VNEVSILKAIETETETFLPGLIQEEARRLVNSGGIDLETYQHRPGIARKVVLFVAAQNVLNRYRLPHGHRSWGDVKNLRNF
jgi:hypothetical protein